jgi:hypothetical protein
MRLRKRFGFSEVEKSKIWSRWKSGQSLHEIGRAFDKPHSSIRCLLLPRGGIPPAASRRAPAFPKIRAWVSSKLIESSVTSRRSEESTSQPELLETVCEFARVGVHPVSSRPL